VTVRKYVVLLAVVIFGSSGDVCLSRGMRDFGAVSSSNWTGLLFALSNPWILAGVGLLILFFCTYLTALSWADLTYVLPATAISYVLMALLASVFLHENVTLAHWLGIGLITAGVGFVATGPSLTAAAHPRPVPQGHKPQAAAIMLNKGARSDA
jgi:drug/metabolite transporter (DMT)-like permease